MTEHTVSRQRLWQIRNADKHATHRATYEAVQSGQLVRPPTCSKCPATDVQAHHEDYSRPLDVVWLCSKCHRHRHVEMRAPVLAARRADRAREKQAARNAATERRRRERRAHLIAEAGRWRDLTGDWPTSTHWHLSAGTSPDPQFLAALLAFRDLTGPWPQPANVSWYFGRWGAFIEACGGVAVGTCAGVRHGDRAEQMRAAIARLESARLDVAA